MVRLAEFDNRVNIWMTEQHISSNFSALDCHSATCRQQGDSTLELITFK